MGINSGFKGLKCNFSSRFVLIPYTIHHTNTNVETQNYDRKEPATYKIASVRKTVQICPPFCLTQNSYFL